jgi:hypothetical protein
MHGAATPETRGTGETLETRETVSREGLDPRGLILIET